MRRLKTNKKYITKAFYIVFGVLPLLVTLYMYPMIPDNIPVHYFIDGTIDKWGSKKELFIVPTIILLFVCLQPKLFNLNFNYEAEDKITKWNNPYFLIILNILVYSTIYISINFKHCLSHFNFYNFFACSICFMFGFIGNYIPDSNRNSSVSIRTKYTLLNDILWSKIHHFCGYLWFSGSIIFLPIFLFSSGYYLLIFSILMLAIFILSPLIYTHCVYEKYLKEKLNKKIQSNNIQHSHGL